MPTPHQQARRYAQRSQLKWLLWRIPVLIMLAIITGAMIATTGCAAYHGERWNFATPGIESTIDGSTIDTKLLPHKVSL